VDEMKAFIQFVAKTLVDHPDDVEVTEVESEKALVFQLRCNKEDIGQIIGRGGRTIKALRTLLVTAAAKHDLRAALEILD